MGKKKSNKDETDFEPDEEIGGFGTGGGAGDPGVGESPSVGVNGGRNPGHWGGAKAGQFELGGGRARSALFDSAVASERPVGFGRVVEAQTIPGSTAGA